jgi:hypothetical protein
VFSPNNSQKICIFGLLEQNKWRNKKFHLLITPLCQAKRGTKTASRVLKRWISPLETIMHTFLRLGVPALFLAAAALAGPAFASLETSADYSALPQDEIALNEYTASVACTPTQPHYLPSFIRTSDGTIIGVGYMEVESDGTC